MTRVGRSATKKMLVSNIVIATVGKWFVN